MKTHFTLKPVACIALLGITLGGLVACGGGGGSSTPAVTVAAPTTVTVNAPQTTPSSGNTSTGINQTGSLQYLVYDNTSLTSGLGTTAVAAINADASTITFPAAAPFPTGLVIGAVTTNSITFNGITGVGGASPLGNAFVFCSAGRSTKAVDEPAAMAGTKVALSGNVLALSNIAALYGKKFGTNNCTNSGSTVTFGDGNGNLIVSTVEFNGSAGVGLTAAQVVEAFSTAGYTFTTGDATGVKIKLRAYSLVENGTTKYYVVVLQDELNRGVHSDLLYLL